MIFFALFLIIVFMVLGSHPDYIPIVSLCFFIPINIAVWITCAKTHSTPPTQYPPKEEKKQYSQTEDEFNEMAMTTLYANMWLDDDSK